MNLRRTKDKYHRGLDIYIYIYIYIDRVEYLIPNVLGEDLGSWLSLRYTVRSSAYVEFLDIWLGPRYVFSSSVYGWVLGIRLAPRYIFTISVFVRSF